MDNSLDSRNNNKSLQRAQAGSMVVKELKSASSGFSLSPESRPSAAAVEAEKHNPKVEGTDDLSQGGKGKLSRFKLQYYSGGYGQVLLS
jgi:hypothetical protein